MSEYIITQGVDLHKRYFVYNSLDRRDGEEKEGKVYLNDMEGMERYFSQFDVPSEVAVEASGSWYWFVDMLQKNGVKVHLSNPKQTKAIAWAKVKNDKVDARMLRKLLESNLLPECWIPEKKARDLREIIRYRMKLVSIRSQLKNMIHSYLSKQNVIPEWKNIWQGKGREWLEEIVLDYPHQEMKFYCLKIIDVLDGIIQIYDEKLKESEYKPEGLDLVLTLPNTGYTRALTIVLETGPIEMFKSAKGYVSCCGLAPRTRESGGKIKQGGLSKEARLPLKYTYIEIANGRGKLDELLERYYERIKRRKGKSIAKISLARKIAKGVYHMLKKKITFQEYERVYLVR